MKIFITGGTGFIGKHVVNRLKDDNQLLVLTRIDKKKLTHSKNPNYVNGSLVNIDKWKTIVKKFNPDATIHIAWEGIPDYGIEMSIKNLNYGLTLYKFLSHINCKTILTTGSCWEYGGQNGKLSEDKVFPKPFNAFTAAKNSLNFLGQEIAKKNNLNFIWTRLFYIYGPGQKEQSLIPYLISCARTNQIPELKNPEAQNDFVFVEDVADAISMIIQNPKSGISTYNLGSGKLTSVKDIAEIIFKHFGTKTNFKKGTAKQTDSLQAFYADLSKIRKEAGWKPQFSISRGIKKTILESLSLDKKNDNMGR